jgi:hypothetical protein
MAAFAGLVAVVMVVALRFGPRLPPGQVEKTGPDAVMPGAEDFISDFEAAGLRCIGGFRWNLRGRLVIETVLAAPRGEYYAIVTDRILELASRFGDRALITINRGRAPLPADVLRQTIRHGGPDELLEAHRAALDLLARRGLEPDRFRDDSEILATVRAADERDLRSGNKLADAPASEHERRKADPQLGDDAESERRIGAWLGTHLEPER